MATPYRCTVTIDGTKFNAVSTSVTFATEKEKSGMPKMGSLLTEIRVWADFHDDTNLPFSAVQKFFNLANVVTRDKIKDMKIEFWKDDSHQDALCSYSFKGWVSRFETSNGEEFTKGIEWTWDNSEADKSFVGLAPNVNHLLVLDLEPALSQEHFGDLKMSN
ncbi:MAG: hypothetical protein ABSC08_02735 [Bryobacteraceae bacterium]